MTPINKPVKRETSASYRGRNLIIEVGRYGVTMREKGRRKGYTVSFDAIFSLGAKAEARATAAEKLKAKKARAGR